MDFTTNPVRIFFAIVLLVLCISNQIELWSGDVFRNAQNMDAVQADIYEWASANCKPLNITEIDNVDDFVDGCYYFEGHLRVEGNITVPPLPDTTQCDTLVAYNYVQTYGSYLVHACNELGQHKECHDYNPACKQDYTDVANGFGYRIAHGWLPNMHSNTENWYSLVKTFELENIIAQSDEWKVAMMNNQPWFLKFYPETCNVVTAGKTTLCTTNQGFPPADQLNNTEFSHLYLDQALADSRDEAPIIANDPENLKIYDIGKTDGNAIHLNIKMPWDYGYHSNKLWRARMEEVYGPEDTWFEKYHIGTEDKGLLWPHRSQTPQDPEKGREIWRENVASAILGKNDLYQLLGNQMLFKFASLVKNDDPDAREQPTRTIKDPNAHNIGDLVSAPNALGDSFYADADLETIRLNGTTPVASPNYVFTGKKIPVYPVIWGPEVLAKLQANGGSFTDAEFKALPEYGSPDLQHFPLASNLTYWDGTDNCPHILSSFDGPEFLEGSLRMTPVCRIKEPTDKHLEWLGLVHKKNHAQTGDTMLVWNPIHFSDEDFSDANVLAPETTLWPLGKDLKKFQADAGMKYPHKRLLQSFFDLLLDNGAFFGYPWSNNPLGQPLSTGTVWYTLLWHWYQLPFLFEVRDYSSSFDYGADLANKAATKRAAVNKKYYVNRNITCLLLLGFIWLLIWDAKKKRESEDS